ncbi:MAG: ribosome biogenesis GTPase Der, partial [Hyphomicrobiales bacterium]|nr:ribosome biogenesis GTPase Der [Hyphomicrobiales bacterium]
MPVTIAIIGRPNVGKSTLFNRLVGRRLALVDDRPGVTRDRRQGEAKIGDLSVDIIDTAGLEDAADETLAGRMRAQTDAAIAEADLVLFMIDARAGITPLDEHFAALARAAGKPLILVANKAEGRASDTGYYEAFSLGFGEPVAISAEHGLGMPDLYEAILDALGPAPQVGAQAGEISGTGKPVNIAVVGRPNAGKSTLINKLIGKERLLTGPEAGITRDSIAVDWTWRDKPFRLFDTAGLRRKARVIDRL